MVWSLGVRLSPLGPYGFRFSGLGFRFWASSLFFLEIKKKGPCAHGTAQVTECYQRSLAVAMAPGTGPSLLPQDEGIWGFPQIMGTLLEVPTI